MARKSLILVPLALLLMSARGCETVDHAAALSAAKQAEAVAAARPNLPNLPAACTVKTGRVYPTLTEARVITQKRWLAVADNRDRQAEDCAAWWASYRFAMEGAGH